MNDHTTKTLYHINDVLSALCDELVPEGAWRDDDEKADVLNDLTHEVAQAFRITR